MEIGTFRSQMSNVGHGQETGVRPSSSEKSQKPKVKGSKIDYSRFHLFHSFSLESTTSFTCSGGLDQHTDQ